MLQGLLVAEGCKIGRRHVKTLMSRVDANEADGDRGATGELSQDDVGLQANQLLREVSAGPPKVHPRVAAIDPTEVRREDRARRHEGVSRTAVIGTVGGLHAAAQLFPRIPLHEELCHRVGRLPWTPVR
jgi:hypothetical protein